MSVLYLVCLLMGVVWLWCVGVIPCMSVDGCGVVMVCRCYALYVC